MLKRLSYTKSCCCARGNLSTGCIQRRTEDTISCGKRPKVAFHGKEISTGKRDGRVKHKEPRDLTPMGNKGAALTRRVGFAIKARWITEPYQSDPINRGRPHSMQVFHPTYRTDFGSGPKRFSPGVPSRTIRTKSQMTPINGTREIRSHHPRRFVS